MTQEQTLPHTPLTEEEALGLLPKGDYEGYIRTIEINYIKKDKSRPCFVATIDVYDSDGRPVTLKTWLGLPALLKHMYDAAGKSDKYQNSSLSTKDCEGSNVICRVMITKPTNDYPTPANKIWDFIKPKAKASMSKQELIDEVKGFNDPVPSF